MVRVLTQSLKIVSILVVAALVLGGSAWFFDYWQDRTRAEEIGRPVTIQITDEDDSASVAEKLTDADLVRFGAYFEARMRFSGRELQPGTYTLRIGMSVPEIIDVVSVPEAGGDEETAEGTQAPQAFDVTFVEGQRMEQLAATLQDAGMPDGAQAYLDAASNVENFRASYPILRDVPQGASLEGYLFPDTYTVGSNAGAADVIGLQLSNLEAQFTEEMRQQAEAAGLTIHEVMTLASIVEREAVLPEERPIIAAVYLNRLESGEMRLEADPTVQYAVGTPDEWWPRLNTELLEQARDHPYNTYTHDGLPPGPISNPGFASIQAVLQPADVDYLFFVANSDGSGQHIFATTYEEHLQNLCTHIPEAEDCQGGAMPDGVPVAERARNPWWETVT